MFANIRSTWLGIKASYWFYPAIFALFCFLLALGIVEIDRSGEADWLNKVSWMHLARPDGASNMLTVLAGSMIGVASTVFSITIAAVAYASGTYGPRLLTNFMEDKGNQLSLATFIGTFVYAITVLRTVRAEGETAFFAAESDAMPGFVPQLALLVGFGLMIVAVGVLVYFLHHIPSSIRINTVLEDIGRNLLRLVDKRYPEQGAAKPERRPMPDGAKVLSQATGYIRYLDFGTMREVARKHGVVVGLNVRVGDFLQKDAVIGQLDVEEVEEQVADHIRSCFALGGSRTPEQDIEFWIDELVEIAQRALSPGINDPFTAITALHWLGAATAQLGQKNLAHNGDGIDSNEKCVIPVDDDFAHFLARGFGATRSAVAGHKLAALVAFDCLAHAASIVDHAARKALISREAALLMAQTETILAGPELDEVRSRHLARFG